MSLEKGDQAGAAAKFAEADRLDSTEIVQGAAPPAAVGIELTAASDPAVRQSSATGPGPDLTAPADAVEQQAAPAQIEAPQGAPVADAAAAPAPAGVPVAAAPVAAGVPVAAAPDGEPRGATARAKRRRCSRTATTRRPSNLRCKRRKGSSALTPRRTS